MAPHGLHVGQDEGALSALVGHSGAGRLVHPYHRQLVKQLTTPPARQLGNIKMTFLSAMNGGAGLGASL